MAISTKNKRKIVVHSRTYYWWVTDDIDGEGNMLGVNIVSEDTMLLIKYWAFGRKDGMRLMTVKGHEFPGVKENNGNSVRLDAPDFLSVLGSKEVTPKIVEAIITWCFESGERSYDVKVKL